MSNKSELGERDEILPALDAMRGIFATAMPMKLVNHKARRPTRFAIQAPRMDINRFQIVIPPLMPVLHFVR